ncbi:Nuclease SbcCD subunit C [Patescibacteria group bacterium]|nr:Nuclease SbcCD subunit C [Patescibacteria group bacterium]
MKILNLHFKNINCLEGETRIDFTDALFANTGVFAITGPHGSGKSSVLDAITLALYGETFRFNKPAAHVMTKQTSDCFAVIEFSLGADTYQSGWRVEKIGDEFKPAQMQLMNLNTGNILATTPAQVCQQMTDITGMNFRNFTRAVLLAQGDFAAFLNALDNERVDILEKMMSFDIYADYKQDITNKANKAQDVLKQTQAQLDAIVLLDPEKIEAYEHDLADFKEQYAEVAVQNKALKEQQAAIKNIAVMQAQVNVQKKNLKQAKQDAQNVQQQLDDIATHQNIIVYQEEALNVQQQEQAIKQHKAELINLQSELIALKSQLGNATINTTGKTYAEQQQLIGELKKQLGQITANAQSEVSLISSLDAQIVEKQATSADLKNWLDQRPADASLLEHFPDIPKLTRLRAELLELGAQHKRLNKQTKEAIASLNGNTSALEKETAKLASDTGQLAQDEQDLAELQTKYTLETLTELRQDQQERVKGFQELNDIAAVYQRLSKNGGGLFSWFSAKKTKEDDIDLVELEKQHEELKLEVQREENIKIVLEQAVLQEDLLKKLAQHREHLIDGKPCPLCGALDHPYSKKQPIIRSSQNALNHQIAKIKDLLGRTYDVGRRLETLKHKVEHDNSTWARRQRLSSQWFILANRLNAHHPDLTIENLDLMVTLLKAEQEEFKNITELAIRYREKQQNIIKLQASIEKSNATIERLKTAVDGFTADSEVRSQQHIEFEQKLRDCQQEEQQVAEQVINQLTALGEKIPSKNKENLLFERLTARKQSYQDQLLQHKALQDDIALLTEKRTACDTAIRTYKQQLDSVNAQIQNEENVLLQLTVSEKQAQVSDKERFINEQTTELQQKQQTLLGKIQPTFSSLTALNDILTLLQSQPKLEQQLVDRLLGQTNAILEKISGRYYLRQKPSDQGLALVIEDTLQNNTQRLPKTLSGGESFVVSLALALGLAEMASNGRSVDSLFIDEGFGNLDAETLYVIISTLENLQTQGKTVGVISHVEAVHQRFKAQLQVVKKPNGMGMLQQAS